MPPNAQHSLLDELYPMLARIPAGVRAGFLNGLSAWTTQGRPSPTMAYKKLNTRKGRYFRIKLKDGYRAIAELHGNEYEWFWIGSHAEYDAFIKKL